MMFGSRAEFDYYDCLDCETIQIIDIPDLAEHYPPEYNTLTPGNLSFSRYRSAKHLARLAASHYIGQKSLPGKIAATILRAKTSAFEDGFPPFLREPVLNLRKDRRILDIGSGAGDLLRTLEYYGFTDLVGVDKYIQEDIVYSERVRIYKRSLEEIEEDGFDLAMLNHVLEHLEDPGESLVQVKRVLKENGCCLVRIPVRAFAWEKYGANWFQLDPPRHLHIFSENGFRRLANECGYRVEKVTYDSNALQFIASEFYAEDVSLKEQTRQRIRSRFSEAQLEAWELEARELNTKSLGDQACFYLFPER